MKNILGYIFCLGIGAAVTYFISGVGGIMIIVCLVLSLALSLVDFMLVRNKFDFKAQTDEQNFRKGENAELKVSLRKLTILPAPFVEIKFTSSPKLKAVDSQFYKVSLGFDKKPTDITVKYAAMYSGKAHAEIESVVLTDYMGILRQNIYKRSEQEKIVFEFNIMPDIPDVNITSDLIKTSSEAIGYSDDEEETSETTRFGAGVAGYEHRQYVPGDPIKRINWKLSSKRDIFFVRLDEKINSTNQSVVFDLYNEKPAGDDFRDNDLLIESALSVMVSMIRQEQTCNVYLLIRGKWETIEIKDEPSVIELQRLFGEYDSSKSHSSRIPPEIKNEKGTSSAVIFTNCLDSELIESCQSNNTIGFFVTTENHIKISSENCWIVNNLYELKRV